MKNKKHGLLTKNLRKKLMKSSDDREMLRTLAAASKELDDEDLFLVTGGAQYEASQDGLFKDISELSGNSNISKATQDAIAKLMDSNAPFTVLGGNNDAVTNSEAIVTSKSGNLDQAQPAVFDNANLVVDQGDHGVENPDLNHTDFNQHDSIDNVSSDQLIDGINNSDNNSISLDRGDSVNTGDGNEPFQLMNNVHGLFDSGIGNNGLVLDDVANKNAEISVDAGDGFDLMKLFGTNIKHSFSFRDGDFRMQ